MLVPFAPPVPPVPVVAAVPAEARLLLRFGCTLSATQDQLTRSLQWALVTFGVKRDDFACLWGRRVRLGCNKEAAFCLPP